jgi:hypothetical protein
LPELFSDFKISTGKFLGFSTFAPKIFGPANFRPEFFLNFQISNRKKFPKTQIPRDPILADLRRGRELVAELTPFFPTFAPTFFGIFNFQSKNFPVFKISSRKFFRLGTFNPKKFGLPEFQTDLARFDRSCGNLYRLMRSVGECGMPGCFSGFRGDRPEIFWAHGLSRSKIWENFWKYGACEGP